jgi:hypothetical protein
VNAVIVLLLLGVIWAAVLIPPWVQSRRETRPIASMRSFHRQLWLLERTSPAHRRGAGPRRRVASSAVTVYGGSSAYAPGDVYDDEFGDAAYDDEFEAYERYDEIDVDELDVDEFDELDELDVVHPDGVGGPKPVRWAGEDRWAEVAEARRRRLAAERSPAAARRRLQGYRRRRRVLATLLLVAVATAPPAALVGGTGWWVAHAVADTLLVGYVALLVRRQRRSVEREEKVHYLAPIRAPRPPVVVLHGGAAP